MPKEKGLVFAKMQSAVIISFWYKINVFNHSRCAKTSQFKINRESGSVNMEKLLKKWLVAVNVKK